MSAPGSFPGSGALTPSIHPSSPVPASSLSLSPSGPSGFAQLPGTPSQKPSVFPGGPGALVHPFELTVFHARVHYWSGDALGYIDALSRILTQCKDKAREEGRVIMQRRKAITRDKGTPSEETHGNEVTDTENEGDAEVDKEPADDILTAAEANLSMWLERLARVCLILASQMIEMNVGAVFASLVCSRVASDARTTKRRSTCSPRFALTAPRLRFNRRPLRSFIRPSHGSISYLGTLSRQRNTL